MNTASQSPESAYTKWYIIQKLTKQPIRDRYYNKLNNSNNSLLLSTALVTFAERHSVVLMTVTLIFLFRVQNKYSHSAGTFVPNLFLPL
jgi:hypothetical protein